MKRIAVFIPSLEYGGAERVTSYIVNYLCNQKYEVELFNVKKSEKEYSVHKDAKRIITDDKKKIKNELTIFSPDLAVVVFAPQIISLYPIFRKLGIVWVTSERNDPKRFAGKRITRILYQFLMRSADGVVFQTHQAQEYYRSKLKGREAIIYNPIKLDGFPDVYEGKRRKTIVNVGRLHYQKNQKMLINAFKIVNDRFPDYSLEIYGEGPLRAELENQIHQLKLEASVKLMGSHSDVLERERDCMAFVLSSDFEGMPNALIEAMALGLPVISTKCPCGGPEELITDHQNGTLIPVGETQKLADAIIELISDNELRSKYTKEAVKIRDILCEKVIMQKWEEFFKKVVGDKQ